MNPPPNQFSAPRKHSGWPIMAVLIGPAVVSALSVLAGAQSASIVIAFVSSVLAGVAASVMLLRTQAMSPWLKALLLLVLAAAFGFACFVMSCFGCAFGEMLGGKAVIRS
jgi:hypothetical protein